MGRPALPVKAATLRGHASPRPRSARPGYLTIVKISELGRERWPAAFTAVTTTV
jgi:hypothetical protein